MLFRNTLLTLGRRGYGLLNSNSAVKFASSKTDATKVVVADDGRTLVCWHPEPQFPYEHTLPLPVEEEDNPVIKSLKSGGIRDVSHLKGKREELARAELMKMTHTSKHRWFPQLQKRKAKKTPMDRPYL